jgi:hypothetical protein
MLEVLCPQHIIEPTYWKNDAIQDEILKCIINIESDSESNNDNDMASDGLQKYLRLLLCNYMQFVDICVLLWFCE